MHDGIFSSESLAELAPGLGTYINSSTDTFRLIVSPYIQPQDQAAIEQGVQTADDTAVRVLEAMLVTENLIATHALKCLSYLLRIGRMELRIAVMRHALFHPKVWLFRQGELILAIHGSSNMTQAGIRHNYEQISVSRSWLDPTQAYVTEKLAFQFQRLWNDQDDTCKVITATQALKNRILQAYSGEAPTETELRSLYKRASAIANTRDPVEERLAVLPPSEFTIPSWLEYQQGPFEHQGRAVQAWCDAGFCGVLEMATGSGKTITAMVAAYQLFETHQPLLIVVAAPYVPLMQQWHDEIVPFGLKPVNLTTLSGAQGRTKAFNQIKRRLRLGLTRAEAVIVSHDTLCSPEFLRTLQGFECDRLLIADEAHNLGRAGFVNSPPEFFEHRLALSATPIRQHDDEGTAALFAFFGPVVFRFTLEEAIGRCLVEYDYHVHPVRLTPSEMDRWKDLSDKIRQNMWREDEGKPDEFLTKLFRDRRALLEMAENKIAALGQLLRRENLRTLHYTLVYATDKGPAQLDAVNDLLNRHGVLFHQLTAEETGDREKNSADHPFLSGWRDPGAHGQAGAR